MVQTILAIAKEFDLKVIAEGVEGQEESQFLTEIGCDYAQGYYFSRPLPANDFEKKVASSERLNEYKAEAYLRNRGYAFVVFK